MINSLMPWSPFSYLLAAGEIRPFVYVLVGGFIAGVLLGALASVFAAYAFSRRLYRTNILDRARQDIKGPMGAYVEWLTSVSGEFSLWNTDFLPAYLTDSNQDQFELNRMRKLFVDQRNALWLTKLDEYDTLLEKFKPAVRAMWIRQAELHEAFSKVFKNLETDPPEAVKAGELIQSLAFEQGQLVSDFLYHLQYECLKSVASSRPAAPRLIAKPRIIRTAMGRIRLVTPKPVDMMRK